MTFGTAWPCDSGAYGRVRLSPNVLPQRILGGAALACVAFACAWTMCANLVGTGADHVAGRRADTLSGTRADRVAGFRADKLAAAQPPRAPSSAGIAAFESRFAASFPLLKSAALPSNDAAAAVGSSRHAIRTARESAARRSDDRRSAPTVSHEPSLGEAAQGDRVAANAPAARQTIFDKLFGKRRSIFEKLFGPSPAKVALAYATPDGGGVSDGQTVASGRYDRQTAVYDIAAHAVYLPEIGRAHV